MESRLWGVIVVYMTFEDFHYLVRSEFLNEYVFFYYNWMVKEENLFVKFVKIYEKQELRVSWMLNTNFGKLEVYHIKVFP